MKIWIGVIVSFPIFLMAYNFYAGGSLFYNMTPLAYFLYFVMPALAVVAYFVGGMETVEDRQRKLDKQAKETEQETSREPPFNPELVIALNPESLVALKKSLDALNISEPTRDTKTKRGSLKVTQ